MGHNVSKKTVRITEINSVSIRQSLANGDVEISEHGTLSGNPGSKKSFCRSGLTKSIRRSLKPSLRTKSKCGTVSRNGSFLGNERAKGAAPAEEEPDASSTPILQNGQDSHKSLDDVRVVVEDDEIMKSKRKKKPYRRDSILVMKSSQPATEADLTPENTPMADGTLKRENSKVILKKRELKGSELDFVRNGSDSTPKSNLSEQREDKCVFQRFEKQRSTTRRKAKKKDENTCRITESNTSKNSPPQNGTGRRLNGDNKGGISEEIQTELGTHSIFISPTKLYNILNDGGPDPLRETKQGHLTLVDTRNAEDYDTAHITSSQQISLNQSDWGVDLGIPYSWIVLYDDDGQSHFVSQSTLTTALDRLAYLGHKAKILQGGFQSFVSKYPFMCQTDENYISNNTFHYPSEIIKDRLYLGSFRQGSSASVITDLEIVYVLNIGNEMVKPVTASGRVMNIQFRENSKNDLLQVMPHVLSVISSALEERSAKILVTCSTGNDKSAAVVALYLMHKKKWSLEKAIRCITHCRQSTDISPGICQQLRRCEKFVSQAY